MEQSLQQLLISDAHICQPADEGWNNNGPPDSGDQFPWSKWQLWTVNVMASHPAELPSLP